jgi:glutamate-1-semialdehyde aminotransferase
MQRGVDTMGGNLFILSAAHTEEDINQTVKAFADSLKAMITEGSLKKC